jgi:hypothetical protein
MTPTVWRPRSGVVLLHSALQPTAAKQCSRQRRCLCMRLQRGAQGAEVPHPRPAALAT